MENKRLPDNPPPGNATPAEGRRRVRGSKFLATGLLGLSSWAACADRLDDTAGSRFDRAHLSQTHLALNGLPHCRARLPQTDGKIGMRKKMNLNAWRLRVIGYGRPGRVEEFTMADVRALPRVDMLAEFRCREGWSTVVQWSGVRLADFLRQHPLATRSGLPADPANPSADLAPYVSLMTPDEEYYVGLDIKSALHPQTLLAYEMNGQPLTEAHGAPLRLVMPLKYGVKSLKRIGIISFGGLRPADYWTEMGYDWDAGH